jgi:hypothetical protein
MIMKPRFCATDQKRLPEELAALSGDTVKSLKVIGRNLLAAPALAYNPIREFGK